MITVSDVRRALGQAFTTEPDDETIQSFIDEREAELKEIIGIDDLSSAPHQALLKKWLLNKVCIDVLRNDMLGKDSADTLSYSIGELKEDKSPNIKLKQEWIQIMEQAAEEALQAWFLHNVKYGAVSP